MTFFRSSVLLCSDTGCVMDLMQKCCEIINQQADESIQPLRLHYLFSQVVFFYNIPLKYCV